jgi:putative Ca2+/H+ antiporter (TMEM165/GDT1 family)
MTLAARHGHWPVLLGATTAFIVLNTLAVVFGAGVAAWIPEQVIAGIVAVLFGAFGIHALLSADESASETVTEKPGHGVFFATLLLILVAEFGDKTQIAVAGLAGSLPPLPVWLGATVALVLISALGVWVGCTIFQRLPLSWLRRVGGGVFLVFAVAAGWRALA